MEVLRTAILDMLRRKKGKSFFSSEVVQHMYPEDWEQFIEDVNKEALSLSNEGLINITDDNRGNAGSLKISPPNKL